MTLKSPDGLLRVVEVNISIAFSLPDRLCRHRLHWVRKSLSNSPIFIELNVPYLT